MSFASTAELATYLGRTFTAGAETTQAQQFLDLATAEIRRYTGQTISLVASDALTVDAPVSGPIFLPEVPVNSVASVTVNGTALVVANDVDFTSYGVLYRTAVPWSSGLTVDSARAAVVVTYSHGYATVPDDVKSVCLSMTAERLQGRAGTTADSEGNPVSVSQVRPNAGLHEFTDQERDVLDRYRLIAVA